MMERELTLTKPYIYLPVCAGKTETKLEIFLEDESAFRKKIYEFKVPVADIDTDIFCLPVPFWSLP